MQKIKWMLQSKCKLCDIRTSQPSLNLKVYYSVYLQNILYLLKLKLQMYSIPSVLVCDGLPHLDSH